MTNEEYRVALAAATLPNTPTDRTDERHDVPAITQEDRAGCDKWLRDIGFLCPGKDDETWEKIKSNWIGFIAATCRIPTSKVAPLAPNRKIVHFSSSGTVTIESQAERNRRFRQDLEQRMRIQASFWNHLDGLEGLTERWPHKVFVMMNSQDRSQPGAALETLAAIWDLGKRRRYQAIWTSLVAFLVHSNDEDTLGEMGLKLDDNQIDDILDVKEQITYIDLLGLEPGPDAVSGVWKAVQRLLVKAMEKKESTSRNNPLVWWMYILVRSALSGEMDFISCGKFNRNPIPMDVDIRGRMEAIVHYSKVLALDAAFHSWDVQQEWVHEVQCDLNSVDITWIDGEKGGRPAPSMDKRTCSSEAWQSILAHIETCIPGYLGGKKGMPMHRIRKLEDDMNSSRGAGH
ncbi:hypothetical protein VCV18_011394 [Metarhizium anisopliae]